MDFKPLVDVVLGFLKGNETLVEAALFALGFAESLVLVSIFVPATVLFLGIGAMHEASGGSFMPIMIAAALGAFFGDVVSYFLGRHYRERLTGRWPLRDHPHWLPNAHAFLDRWGIPGLVLAKFLGPLRSVAPAACGVAQMPLPRFLVATAIGSVVWSLVLLGPPYYGFAALGW